MTNKNARVWTGTEWANVSAAIAVPNAIAYYQTTAPSSPTTGQVWVNSTTETFYVWSGSAWEQQNVDLSEYLTSATAAATYVSAATVSSTYAPKASPVFTGTVDASGANFVPPVQTSGRNIIINGSFDVWQRGTSFSTNGAYTADRWAIVAASGQTVSVTQQTFTPGAAPVVGYEGTNFLRAAWSGTPSGTYWLTQRVEGVRNFANQTVTLSFWAKASSNTSLMVPVIEQNFGSGGSSVVTTTGTNLALTTVWQRFSQTFNIPSISGKTVGTNSYLDVRPFAGSSSVNGITFDLWGVQLEEGGAATPFETEPYADILRKSQRYYQRINNWYGLVDSSTLIGANAQFSQPMRVAPVCTKIAGSTLSYRIPVNDGSSTTWTFSASTPTTTAVWFQIGNLTGLTTGQATHNRGAGTDIVEASAEL